MKRNVFYTVMMIAAAIFTTSCGDDGDDWLDDWMVANQQALNGIKANPEFKELESPGGEGSIYYRVIKSGDGKKPVYYTSTVSVYLKGWFVSDYPYYDIKKNAVFDQLLFDDGSPYSFNVATGDASGYAVINGWKTAVQNMVEGDKWEIWIPYQLAYGRYGRDIIYSFNKASIPGYSTLAYEIEVVKVYE
ncbi:MAG: FKBP-type peptidyl-prolyl cis-trans isomerase [Tannerella sp.]|jgi:peptidylprolyl isomerase/FKBP-type peptidyl-prolyl cis-trans isomerase FklB|nr:FKBP-type peptidyl-prolyl cis-trans isomerase [Tannerella sp.]